MRVKWLTLATSEASAARRSQARATRRQRKLFALLGDILSWRRALRTRSPCHSSAPLQVLVPSNRADVPVARPLDVICGG